MTGLACGYRIVGDQALERRVKFWPMYIAWNLQTNLMPTPVLAWEILLENRAMVYEFKLSGFATHLMSTTIRITALTPHGTSNSEVWRRVPLVSLWKNSLTLATIHHDHHSFGYGMASDHH